MLIRWPVSMYNVKKTTHPSTPMDEYLAPQAFVGFLLEDQGDPYDSGIVMFPPPADAQPLLPPSLRTPLELAECRADVVFGMLVAIGVLGIAGAAVLVAQHALDVFMRYKKLQVEKSRTDDEKTPTGVPVAVIEV